MGTSRQAVYRLLSIFTDAVKLKNTGPVRCGLTALGRGKSHLDLGLEGSNLRSTSSLSPWRQWLREVDANAPARRGSQASNKAT